MLDIEVANKIEGIVAQNMEHINKLGFKEVCQLNNISQWSFKSLVRKYINKKNESYLLNAIKNYKKLDHSEMSQEKYERKPYFYNMTLEDTRFAFRISSKMLNVKKNFAQKYRRNNLSLTCELCREEETERDNESSQPHQDIQEKP